MTTAVAVSVPWQLLAKASADRPILLVGGFVMPTRIAWLLARGVHAEWEDMVSGQMRWVRTATKRAATGSTAGCVLLNEFIGHLHVEAVVRACKGHGVPFALAGRGGQAALAAACDHLERALARVHGRG